MKNLQQKYKILHIVDFLNGGVASLVLQYCLKYDQEKFEAQVLVLGSANDRLADFQKTTAKVNIIPLSPKNPFLFIINSLRIIRYVRKTKPDIIHTHMEKSEFVGYFIPKTVRIHTFHYFSVIRRSKNLKNRLRAILCRKLSFRYHAYLAVSDAVRQFFIETDKLRPEKIIRIYNGIDIEYFLSQKPTNTEPGNKEHCFVIGYVGRLSEEKGCDVLLRALLMVREKTGKPFKAYIVGDGQDEEKLRSFSAQNKMDDFVVFTGRQRNVLPYYRMFDVMVMPSHTEGLPMTAIESLSCNVPIIGARVGGVPEIVIDGFNGLLFEDNDSETLSEILRSVIEDGDTLKKLSANCFGWADQHFNIATNIKIAEQKYFELIQRQ